MDLDKLLDFAADTGKCLLESGGETSRVEDTLTRIIRHFYGGRSEILVVLTGFFVNIGSRTEIVRVQRRTINLDRVSKINMMSREIVGGKLSFDEAVIRLEEIKAQKPYSLWIKTFAAALSCSFFTLLQSGGFADGVNSFVTGALVNVILWLIKKRNMADFIITFSGGVMTALFTLMLYRAGLGNNINAMIAGSIMPLVPGLGTTNALRDIIAGDYLSGGARLFDAVVVAVALATGAGITMYMFGNIAGGKLL